MEGYAIIKEIWGKQLIRQRVPDITLRNIAIPQLTKDFLVEVGLPLIGLDSGYSKTLLPFTFFQSVLIKSEQYYILGDISPGFRGLDFVAIKKDNEEIYQITRDRCEPLIDVKFLNQNLYKFLLFLSHYNLFQKKYQGNTAIVKEQIQKDYVDLCTLLNREDARAMSDFNFYWRNRIEYVEVEYGDYLLD